MFFIVTAGADRYLTFNGRHCREHLPGLFFTYDGEALDFRGTLATLRNIPLIRTRRKIKRGSNLPFTVKGRFDPLLSSLYFLSSAGLSFSMTSARTQ